jgi:adenylate cyclase
MGDGFLAEFASAVQAVTCAIAIQKETEQAAVALDEARKMRLRIGIHVGDVMVEGEDLMGDGVNIAARLESIATPGGISISRAVHDQVRDRIDVAFDDKGEIALKNIARPVQVFALAGARQPAAKPIETAPPLRLLDKPSIAVLPFQNMSGDPEQEYFADGIAEDIITALSRFKSLMVSARNSSFTYKGKAIDIKQVGRELGVRYVLEGSVRKGGGKIRITGQLIEVTTGAHLWANRFDGELADIFDLQDNVTEQVVGAIAPMVQHAEIERSKLKRTDNLDAYDTLLRGLSQLQRVTEESTTEALRLFKTAIELDPDYAPAYGRAAYCYMQRNTNGWITDRELETADALRLAKRAVELENDNAEVLTDAAVTIGNVGRDLNQFFVINARATELNPNRPLAWMLNGWGHIYAGEHEIAIQEFQRALRLNPADPNRHLVSTGIATANLLLGRDEEAFAWAERAHGERSNFAPSLRIWAASAAFAGRSHRAREIVGKMLLADASASIAKLAHYFSTVLPYQRGQDIERLLQGLRLAGLPE